MRNGSEEVMANQGESTCFAADQRGIACRLFFVARQFCLAVYHPVCSGLCRRDYPLSVYEAGRLPFSVCRLCAAELTLEQAFKSLSARTSASGVRTIGRVDRSNSVTPKADSKAEMVWLTALVLKCSVLAACAKERKRHTARKTSAYRNTRKALAADSGKTRFCMVHRLV